MAQVTRYTINRNKFLSEEEFQNLATQLNTIGATPLIERDKVLFLLLIHTGARATELLNTTLNDLNALEGTLLIKGIKGSNDREIPLPTVLLKRLNGLLADATPERRLFPITYWRLIQLWDKYKPSTKTVHSLRHTFAIHLYKRTRDLRLVQVCLGHRNIQNTMVYADYLFQTDEIRRGLLGVGL